MALIFVLILFPMLFQHISVKELHINYQKRNRIAITFFFVMLTALVMLRHESVGNDTRNYLHYFKRFAVMNWEGLSRSGLEPGYVVLSKMISLVSQNPNFFLAVSGLLVSAMIYPTYKRLTIDASLTIVLFCCMSTFYMLFSGIRQMLAIGIGVIAYDFARRRKLIFFILLVLLAMTFHTSAFMLALIYPLYHARITKKWLYILVPVMSVIFLLNGPIFGILSTVMERYTKYDGGISSTGAYTMLILFAVLTAFSFIIPDERSIDSEVIGLRNFLLLVLVLQMFAPLHELAMRMNYYYIIFIPLLIPKIVACRSKRWNQVAIAARHIMVIFFALYFFYSASRGGALHVFPYHFFWENV